MFYSKIPKEAPVASGTVFRTLSGLMTFLFYFGLMVALCAAQPSGLRAELPLDMAAIRNDPLQSETLSVDYADGIVIEHISFNGDRDRDGNVIRLTGILAYPEGGTNLPGILWCQGGMSPENRYFPTLFAKKGYFCLNITLATKTWDSFGVFDVANPENANLVRLGGEQLRAVTYIAKRAEVDANRLGVCGSSYGGLFATFVAGVDSRIKVGASFFAAGNHHLGSNLPQFTNLKSLEEIEIWKRTFDPATFISQRDIPFIWGLPTNDNWFFFPAVIETFRQKPGEKRLAILPHWVHGFPPEIDQELFDWFDIWLMGTRDPYLLPSAMKLQQVDGKLLAEWRWTGKPEAKRADLIVSYGRVLPWHGWKHRYYHTVPAVIEGQTAHAEIPVPDPDFPMLVFGNVYDEKGVLTSTDPIEATPRALGIERPTGRPVTDGCPRGRFEPEDMSILVGIAQGFGRVDGLVSHSGIQSIALDASVEGVKSTRRGSEARIRLFNVYERNHRLRVWLRAQQPMTVDIRVQGLPPEHWDSAAVRAILGTIPDAAVIPEKSDIPAFSLVAELESNWKEFEIDVPFTGVAVEGYELNVDRRPGDDGTYWIDDVRFETQW